MGLPRIARLFGWSGRADRREFVVLISVPVAMLGALIWGLDRFAPDGMPGWTALLGLPALLLPIAMAFGGVARRLHDVNLPAVAAFVFTFGVRLSFVATEWATGKPHRDEIGLIALAAGLVCLAIWPGTPGENRFGPARAAEDAPAPGDLSRSDG